MSHFPHIPPADLIGGHWIAPAGPELVTRNPAHPTEEVYRTRTSVSHVDAAIAAARAATKPWAAWSFERRCRVLRAFQRLAGERVDALADLIRLETGKPAWDARAEAQLIASKVEITLEQGPSAAINRVQGFEVPLGGLRRGRAWFRPHGVVAVVGPFNFPAHLPNGHIVPALAMGNTIVFKPAEKTAGVGRALAALIDEALRTEGAPQGVFNLVQGGIDVASSLAAHDDLDAILFTGSWAVGRRIMEANLDRPGRLLALEMGGNNAAIIMQDADPRQAAIECVRSAFISSGQRCTCTRRLLIHKAIAPRIVPAICKAASSLIVGDPAAKHPVFMGPMVSEAARDHVLKMQAALVRAGGELLVPCTIPSHPEEGWYLTPGVMRVGRFDRDERSPGRDEEIFGPLLRLAVVSSLDEAIDQANATQFGLAASIFTGDSATVEQFQRDVRAGCLNVNTGTAGASSKLPFGGLGRSGNHRPAGAFALDYCAYPVAGMMEPADPAAAVLPSGMRFEDSWL